MIQAILLQGIYRKELKVEILTDVHTPMFIAPLPTIAKSWKYPKCPLMDEWISKMWCIFAIEYYLANEVLIQSTVWMKVENISERSRTLKAIYYLILFIWNVENWQVQRDWKRIRAASALDRGWVLLVWGFFFSWWTVLELACSDGFRVLCIYTKSLWTGRFKVLIFMVYESNPIFFLKKKKKGKLGTIMCILFPTWLVDWRQVMWTLRIYPAWTQPPYL